MTISYSGNFFRLLARWKGSIWRSTWKELLIYLALYYAIKFFYMEGIDMFFDTDKSRHEAKWWRQFECLAWPEDLLSLLVLVIPGEDERSQRRRHVIARYLNLTAALAWRDVSSKLRLRFPKVRDLIDAGLMTEQEYVLLEDVHASCASVRWMAPLQWVQQIMMDEVKDNNPTASIVNNFITELKLYRQSFRKIFCHDWVCVPLVYTQVAALATYAFFFFCLFGRQYFHQDDTVDLKVPIFLIVQFLFFVGWFKVGQDLMRPFGMDDDDIELNWILDRNIACSFAIVHKLINTRHPELGEGNEDIFWKNRGEHLEIPKTGRQDKLETHRPKLHAYVRLPTLTRLRMPNSDVPDDEKGITCSKLRGDHPHLSW